MMQRLSSVCKEEEWLHKLLKRVLQWVLEGRIVLQASRINEAWFGNALTRRAGLIS